jgi:hypothetical protein
MEHGAWRTAHRAWCIVYEVLEYWELSVRDSLLKFDFKTVKMVAARQYAIGITIFFGSPLLVYTGIPFATTITS